MGKITLKNISTATVNIVSDKFGVRDIYDKEKLVEEATTYFPKIIRDRNRLNELNDYNMYVFAVKNHFSNSNVDYYWLVRLITENFAKAVKGSSPQKT